MGNSSGSKTLGWLNQSLSLSIRIVGGMYTNVNIMGKMDHCAEDFSHWDKEHGQKTRREIEKVRRKLELTRYQVTASYINYFNALDRQLGTLF